MSESKSISFAYMQTEINKLKEAYSKLVADEANILDLESRTRISEGEADSGVRSIKETSKLSLSHKLYISLFNKHFTGFTRFDV